MSSEMVLARRDLPPDWIDLSLGEPFLIQQLFNEHYNSKEVFKLKDIDVKYPHCQGSPPLITKLRDRYADNIVITNGAKHALGATFYALNMIGRKKVGIPIPYWVSMPQIAFHEKLTPIFIDEPLHSITKKHKIKALIATSPNNPDGKTFQNKYMHALHGKLNSMNIKFIHDAAYYSNAYCTESIVAIGDAQIFSFSKMYGLSGLRLGLIRTKDQELYEHMCTYMEKTTSGVSTASQDILDNIITKEDYNPSLKKNFERDVYSNLYLARLVASTIPGLSDISENGMFLWAKCDDISVFEKHKIKVLDGSLFGRQGYVRLNLAVGEGVMRRVVERFGETI